MEPPEQEKLKILIRHAAIERRVRAVAHHITRDFKGQRVHLIGVLKGACIFLSDLVREINLETSIDFIAVSSYGRGKDSSGQVRLLKDLDSNIKGLNVILVEDILDTGLTSTAIVDGLRRRGPASLALCTLLRKPMAAKMDVAIAYTGFDIDDAFVIGYGLDFAERYRNLPFIGTLAPHVYAATGG